MTAAGDEVVIVDTCPDLLHGDAVLHQVHVALSGVASVVHGHDGHVEDVGSGDGGGEDGGVGVVGAAVVVDDAVEVHHVAGAVGDSSGGAGHEVDCLLFSHQEQL